MAIVLATDLSAECQPAADFAAALARSLNEPLFAVHCIDGPLPSALEKRVEQEQARLEAQSPEASLIIEPAENIGASIAHVGDNTEADVVVLGAHGAGRRPLLGTTTIEILRTLKRPTLIVRHPEPLMRFLRGERLRILVCLGLDDTDAHFHDALALLSRVGPIDAWLAHYTPLPAKESQRKDAVRLADEEARGMLQGLPKSVSATVVVRDGFGRLDVHLSDLARELRADLVLCGSHHRKGVRRLMEGSIAEGIVSHAPVSVLVTSAPASDVPSAT